MDKYKIKQKVIKFYKKDRTFLDKIIGWLFDDAIEEAIDNTLEVVEIEERKKRKELKTMDVLR